MKTIVGFFCICAIAVVTFSGTPNYAGPPGQKERSMSLGNFSVSLNVKDLAVSRAFYGKLGFRKFTGDGKRWLIIQNDTATIGLFQREFEKNTLTFNPGWDRSAKTLAKFEDVRDIQKSLKEQGIQIATEADESSTGAANFMIMDPDGNPILFDQHVPRGGK